MALGDVSCVTGRQVRKDCNVDDGDIEKWMTYATRLRPFPSLWPFHGTGPDSAEARHGESSQPACPNSAKNVIEWRWMLNRAQVNGTLMVADQGHALLMTEPLSGIEIARALLFRNRREKASSHVKIGRKPDN